MTEQKSVLLDFKAYRGVDRLEYSDGRVVWRPNQYRDSTYLAWPPGSWESWEEDRS